MFRHIAVPRWLNAVVTLVFAGALLAGTTACASVPAPNATQTAIATFRPATEASAPATVAPAGTAAPPSRPTAGAAPSPSEKPGKVSNRTVLGYYVPYDATSWASFQAQAGSLDYVGAQWATVDACGNVGSRDDRTLIAYAEERGVKVLPSLLTSSGWLNHQLLTEPATTDHFLSQILQYVEEMGYPGFDLDLEGINAEDRGAYSAFVARLAEALHERGKLLTLAIPAKTTDVRTGWAGPYDYAALGKHADLILLMTYDFSWSSGPPGSIAPQSWVDKVAAYAVSQMPPEKVLIGLAFYGYDWNTTAGGRARALQYHQAAALAKQYKTQIVTDSASLSGSFSYTAITGDPVPLPPSAPPVKNDIRVRSPGQCAVKQPTGVPAPTARPTPVPPPVQEHVVWLEDATSVAGRLEIALRHNTGGVGAWRLGQEDPRVWPHLTEYRSGTLPAP